MISVHILSLKLTAKRKCHLNQRLTFKDELLVLGKVWEGIYFDAKDHNHNGAWILPISVIKSQAHFTRTEQHTAET